MPIKVDKAGDVTVIAPAGRIDSGNAATIETEILKVIGDGSTRIIVDLSEAEYISSAGLRVVLVAAKRQKQRSGSFVLCNLQPLVREIFEVSGLLGLLRVTDSRKDAMQIVAG
jgi:stage II sporulation protein AA (anti-sigma F factor antagonist)